MYKQYLFHCFGVQGSYFYFNYLCFYAYHLFCVYFASIKSSSNNFFINLKLNKCHCFVQQRKDAVIYIVYLFTTEPRTYLLLNFYISFEVIKAVSFLSDPRSKASITFSPVTRWLCPHGTTLLHPGLQKRGYFLTSHFPFARALKRLVLLHNLFSLMLK